MSNKDHKPKAIDQGKRFIEAARELDCDEDQDAFKERLKKLASAPPPASVGKRKEKKPQK